MPRRRQQRVAGIALISAGIAFWFLREVEGFGEAAVFLVVGITFVALYFAKGRNGLLAAGCILTGLGVGELLGSGGGLFEQPTVLCLGVGFVAIWVIGKLHRGTAHWWPLVPGVFLVLLGIRGGERVVEVVVDNWPLAIVAAGVVVLLGTLGTRGK